MANVIKISDKKNQKRHESEKVLVSFYYESENGHNKEADPKIRSKKLCKHKELCYPIKEADSRFVSDFALVTATLTNRQNILAD